MKQVADNVITTLVRCLPIVLANVETAGKSTRVSNAVRLTKQILTKLNKINNNERNNNNNR